MSERCKHDLDPTSCAMCTGMEESVSTWSKAGTFEAQYGQPCADTTCRNRIDEGDLITRWEDGGYFAYTHKGCRP